MKRGGLWLLLGLLLGCRDTIPKEDLPYLNGYWEIERVTLTDGTTKAYRVNRTVDFIQFEDGKGFRKKVNPKFDGTFDTSDDAEFFEIVEEGGRFILLYKNPLSEWKETLQDVSRDYFKVTNEAGILYEYKRFVPINGYE
ncbi:MAG: hypothetical protein AAGA86_01615 [Bacteroidota bacterium]